MSFCNSTIVDDIKTLLASFSRDTNGHLEATEVRSPPSSSGFRARRMCTKALVLLFPMLCSRALAVALPSWPSEWDTPYATTAPASSTTTNGEDAWSSASGDVTVTIYTTYQASDTWDATTSLTTYASRPLAGEMSTTLVYTTYQTMTGVGTSTTLAEETSTTMIYASNPTDSSYTVVTDGSTYMSALSTTADSSVSTSQTAYTTMAYFDMLSLYSSLSTKIEDQMAATMDATTTDYATMTEYYTTPTTTANYITVSSDGTYTTALASPIIMEVYSSRTSSIWSEMSAYTRSMVASASSACSMYESWASYYMTNTAEVTTAPTAASTVTVYSMA